MPNETHCGHPSSTIVSTGEGTQHCGVCACETSEGSAPEDGAQTEAEVTAFVLSIYRMPEDDVDAVIQECNTHPWDHELVERVRVACFNRLRILNSI